MSNMCRTRRGALTPGAVGWLAVITGLAACAGDPLPASKVQGGAPIVSALPQLPPQSAELRDIAAPNVELAFGADSVRVTIAVDSGARVNALQPPVIEERDGRRFTLRAPSVSADSAYFIERAFVTVARTALPIRGTLRTSFCRRDERLCRSAERDVLLEDR